MFFFPNFFQQISEKENPRESNDLSKIHTEKQAHILLADNMSFIFYIKGLLFTNKINKKKIKKNFWQTLFVCILL